MSRRPLPRWADADQIDRAVADVVIAVAAEILRREFPVARHAPFLDAAQDFGCRPRCRPSRRAEVEIARNVAEIFGKGRRRRVPGGPHRALVAAQLRHLDEAPLRPVELRMVGLAEIRHADQPAVGAVAPAVIGAGEDGRVALVVAAHLHAAMAAGIEEHMDLAGPVAAQDHRFLAHARDEVVAGVRDLALVADKQPSAGEDALQLLAVDLLVDEDLAADLPLRRSTRPGRYPVCRHLRLLPSGRHRHTRLGLLPEFTLWIPACAGKTESRYLSTHPQKKNVRFLVSNTFWSRMILRARCCQSPSTRRSRSSRLPTRMSVSVSTRLR